MKSAQQRLDEQNRSFRYIVFALDKGTPIMQKPCKTMHDVEKVVNYWQYKDYHTRIEDNPKFLEWMR